MKIFSFFLFTFLFSFSVLAQSDSYSSIVSVDIIDSSASIAKEKAMAQANREALTNVMSKISNNVSLDYLSDAQILNLVKEVSVVSEKNSDVRYIGELKIVFNAPLLDNYLEEKNIAKIEVYTSKVLIIPIFREFRADTPLLWEQKNLWKKSWDSSLRPNALVNIVTIPTDATNYSILDVSKVVALDTQSLSAIAEANGTQDIFVADAFYDGIEGLVINLSSFNRGQISTHQIKVSGDIGEPKLFDDAIIEVGNYIDSQIKNDNMSQSAIEETISVVYPFEDMRHWLNVEKRLKEIGYIKKINVVAMVSNKTQFKLTFAGGLDKLLYAMRAKFLNLKKMSDYYVLERI